MSPKKISYQPSIAYYLFDLSQHYLDICRLILDKNFEVLREGAHETLQLLKECRKQSPKETVNILRNDFYYSDRYIMIPLLFNFYHALELIVKGILIKSGSVRRDELNNEHSPEKLLKLLKENSTETKIGDISRRYYSFKDLEPMIRDFLKDNNLNLVKMYEYLRYPTDKNFDKSWLYSTFYTNKDKTYPINDDNYLLEERRSNFKTQLYCDIKSLNHVVGKLVTETFLSCKLSGPISDDV